MISSVEMTMNHLTAGSLALALAGLALAGCASKGSSEPTARQTDISDASRAINAEEATEVAAGPR